MGLNWSFHHVTIRTTVYEKAIGFYEALGLTKYIEWKEKMGRCCFMRMAKSLFLEIKEFTEPILEPGRLEHICFHVDDVDAFYRLAIENGAKTVMAPFNGPLNCTPKPIPDSRVCHIRGPSGEAIEIINWFGFKLDV